MTWVRLRARWSPAYRAAGSTGAMTRLMIAEHFNVAETYILTGTAYRHAISGAKTTAEARQVLQDYAFTAGDPATARLTEDVGPDILVRCSPVIPFSWAWFPRELFDAPVVAHGADELNGAIRQAWLRMVDAALLVRAVHAGVTEAEYLGTASMAVLAQSAELHPGLSGRAWSPNAGLCEQDAVVRCTLDTAGTNDAAWEWVVGASGGIIRRPTPTPADERPVIQAAQLATQLGVTAAGPCVLDWTWDGQALTLLAARPVTVAPGVRVFSRTALARLAPNPLSPMAASVFAELVQNLVRDSCAMLFGSRGPQVPDDAARVVDGTVYLDETFTRHALAQAGLPRDTLEALLVQQRLPGRSRPSPAMAIRFTRTMRAVAAVHLIVPRFDRWVSDNGSRLVELNTAPVSVSNVENGIDQLRQLLSLMRPLLLDLLLLLASSSFQAHELKRALARQNMQDHIGEALQAAGDTAGLNPWTHIDRIAARIPDESARSATEALAAGDPDRALKIICADTTIERDIEAFVRAFSFFRTAIVDVGSPTLQERSDLLPAALLRARETGAAARAEAAGDPAAWLDALPGGSNALLKKRFNAMTRISAVTEKAWFYAAVSLSRARLLLLRIGDLLAEKGQLDGRNDILLLALDEVQQERDLLPVIADRQRTGAPAPDIIITGDQRS